MNIFKSLCVILLLAVLTGCANTNEEVQEPSTESNNGSSTTEDASSSNSTNEMNSDKNKNDSTKTDEQLQKQMALDTLQGLADDAEEGKVYRLADGIYIGKTNKDDIEELIGEPEKQDEYDHYQGSMGNASYDLAYDENGVLKEARYFGTNVERQTNLGGITADDLIEQLGKPVEVHPITATGETNYRYHFDDFELQFIIGEDGKTDHVNLLQWS